MGSKHSSMPKHENSVYKLLEIDENSTPEQIRQNYIRLLRKHHPDYGKERDNEKTQQIIAAYTKLKEKNFQVISMELFEKINFYKYSLQYFQRLDGFAFISEVNKIYGQIQKNENVYLKNGNYPSFGDNTTKIDSINRFYCFYKNFKTKVVFERNINNRNIYDKLYDKEERRVYNENIRNLTNSVYLCDHRIKKNVFESVVTVVTKKEEKKKYKKKKDISKYFFYCDACNKGFMSDKTMLNHFKSEKHRDKIKELGLEDRQIDEIMSEIKARNNDDNIDKNTDTNFEETIFQEELQIENTDKQNFEFNDEQNVNNDEQIENENKAENIEIVTNKIINLKIKKTKNKTTRKKPINHKDRENLQTLTCANCKKEFESRNKLFNHIKEEHLSKDK